MDKTDIAVLCFVLTPILMVVHLANVIIFGAPSLAWTFMPPLITLQGMMLAG
jgi:hypothetical protein